MANRFTGLLAAIMRVTPTIQLAALILSIAGLAGCRRDDGVASAASGHAPAVASLVPAATDLIVGMGAGDHLAAVSNYDHGAAAAGLPKVGDYQTIDWEKLARIRPAVIITEYGAGHGPSGFAERARELNVRQVNVRFDRLDDVFSVLTQLGNACEEPKRAYEESRRIARQLRTVRQSVTGEKPVRTIVVTGASGTDLAGRGTYLDDLLRTAGGQNAVTSTGYVTLDREAIAALRPDAVLILMPDQTAQAAASAKANWDTYAGMPAVRNHRVWTFTQSYIMQPGSHVGGVAELFARALHPEVAPASRPSTRNAL